MPVTTWEAFEVAHRKADTQLRAYHERGRKGSVRLERDAVTELDPSHAMYMPANNLSARLKFARIAAENIDAAVAALAADQPVFFVTLIRREYTVRQDQAAAFVVKRLHGWAQQILRGSDYVGMAEGAYFSNLNAAGASFQRAVSWHIHAIVWGIAEESLAGKCDAANARYRTVIDGIAPAHFRPLERDEVIGQALYMCKGQLSEYRVWPRKGEVIDTDTGEITIVGTGRFSQKKRPLRPGDMTRMYNIFVGKNLHKLPFAGGEGRPVLVAIRHEALAELRAFERRETAARAAQQSMDRQHVVQPNRLPPTGRTGRRERG